jgi:hypothetical protein
MTLSADDNCLVVQVPLRTEQRAGRREIIAPAGIDHPTSDRTPTNHSLALALTLARAHRWQRLLESGRYTTIGELAREVGLDNSYLARMLRLTLLAPEIVEAVLEGMEPDGLSLAKLYRLPVVWEEQRRALKPDGRTADRAAPSPDLKLDGASSPQGRASAPRRTPRPPATAL